MVLGMRNKNRRGPSIQVEYLVHVQEIKQWPPTQSLKSVRSVLIQWENGERNVGATGTVTPSLDDGKIEFNESFRLPVTLSRDMSVKNGDTDVFHKNLLEFNLYEPRRDKTVKGQLLGTAIVDLGDYGIVKEVTSVSVPVNCTRSFRNSAQPILHFRIQAWDRTRSGSSLRGRLAKEGSLEKNDGDSVSALMNEEYADEAETGSFTDDDNSSLSSVTASSVTESNGVSPLLNKENGSGRIKSHNVKDDSHHSNQSNQTNVPMSGTSNLVSKSTSVYVSASEVESSSLLKLDRNGKKTMEDIYPSLDEGPSILADNVVPVATIEKLKYENDSEYQISEEKGKKIGLTHRVSHVKVDARTDGVETAFIKREENEENGLAKQILGNERYSFGDTSPAQKHIISGSIDSLIGERPRHVKSVRSSLEPSKTNGTTTGFFISTMDQDAKVHGGEKRNGNCDRKTQELERRIRVLETELREAAAMEVAVYSIAAEHGSSINKVHAPARRLSRLYLQAGNAMKRASAAQSALSGLVVVAKACGNDVPRLTFWLSNCVVLRAIVNEAFEVEQLPVSAGPFSDRNGIGDGTNKTKLKWKASSFEKQTNRGSINGDPQDWGTPIKFLSSLEKLESWIFSRVVESVWWQTLTPHMQSLAAKMVDKEMDSSCKRNSRRISSSGNQQQANISLELWKRAFKDAFQRLCPVRSGGHDCGCLPVLTKLVMEQCVARLDVAMLNAILRESTDDIPTDPVSDPISGAEVLPIPAGKSSFGAGAQLKNAIGNWSRLLADLFDIDDDDNDAHEDGMIDDDDLFKNESSFKPFHLIKSLSDLMMLPKDMLLSESVRREVCPAFGAPLIKHVLDNFLPDEFCPDPIPDSVFEALDSEILHTQEEGVIAHIPCTAPAVNYAPPSAMSLISIIGGSLGTDSQSQLRRSASVCRRSNTSDDELDELDSPFDSILGGSRNSSLPATSTPSKSMTKMVQNQRKNVVRYQLLREV